MSGQKDTGGKLATLVQNNMKVSARKTTADYYKFQAKLLDGADATDPKTSLSNRFSSIEPAKVVEPFKPAVAKVVTKILPEESRDAVFENFDDIESDPTKSLAAVTAVGVVLAGLRPDFEGAATTTKSGAAQDQVCQTGLHSRVRPAGPRRLQSRTSTPNEQPYALALQ